jgi:DNA modification methylase
MWDVQPETGGEMIKPYFQDEWATIYYADCRDILPELPKVDLVLTDPPYGINIAKNGKIGGKKCANVKNYGIQEWDKKPIDDELIKMVIEKANHSIIFGGNYYLFNPSSCWIVWDKDNTANFADCELAWTNYDTAVRKYLWRWNGMLQQDMTNKEYRYHPTQKPLGLFNLILSDYSKETDLILDPFMGSGTTLVAAKKLGRHSIGIEISEKYCEIAVKRLQQTVMNFDIPEPEIEPVKLL